ncbi:MAG: hypothetical protein AABY15_08075 [Nanoarchaeota archaeon]
MELNKEKIPKAGKMAKEIKEIKVPMEFNPGLEKYEPVLPLRKAKNKIKFEWGFLITLIIGALIILGLFLLALKYGLISK